MSLLRSLFGKADRPQRTVSHGEPAGQPERLPVLTGDALLQSHRKTLVAIRQQVGIPDAHWAALYAPLFEHLAYFVQQLPASEAHHHRGVGGLLQHTLETTLAALTLRRGVLLPPNTSAETLADKQDVWTYATATAALLHDLGKPVSDQRVALFDARGKPLGFWNPLAGPIAPPATEYAISFARGRRYRIHPRIPPLLAHYLVPVAGLRWLAEDIDVFESWLATISGGDSEFAGEIGNLIRKADGRSVAENLSGGAPLPAANQAAASLGERLTVAIRMLIDTQKLPLNRPGAAGFVIDDDLWLVSKRVLDELREAIRDTGGVPTRNECLMDELQQSGIVAAHGDRAIWNATIELGTWRQALTLLRIPLTRLWLDPDARPASAADGRVFIESNTETVEAASIPTAAAAPTSALDFTAPSEVATEPDLGIWPPGHEVSNTTTSSTEALSAPTALQPYSQPANPISDNDGNVTATTGAPEAGGAAVQENEFVQWLISGISNARIKINTPDARVHTTAEGLLLVSPGIFRDFAGGDGWSHAQKKLCKLKVHARTNEQTNIWTYRVSGDRRSSLLKGILIPNADALLGLTLPPPNAHLALLSP